MLKRPDSINFSKKNDIHPFESTESLEFWSSKNDASLYCVGLHSKKRPHDLVFARMFDGKVLDMMELGIEMAQGMAEFKVCTIRFGCRMERGTFFLLNPTLTSSCWYLCRLPNPPLATDLSSISLPRCSKRTLR